MNIESINYLDLSSLRERIKLGEINFTPSYQRNGGIWSEEKQLLLIDSILRGYIFPPIYFLRNTYGTWEVIDGLQRLTTIINYFGRDNTAIVKKLNFAYYNIKDMGNLNEKTCKELMEFRGLDFVGFSDKEVLFIENLKKFKIPYILIYDTDEQELKDVFCRLNSGEQLSHGEWLNGLLPTLPLWQITKRFATDVREDGKISSLIYARQKDCNKLYAEFDDERKMDLWFWANLTLTIYKRISDKKLVCVNGKSGSICDEYELLQENYTEGDEEKREIMLNRAQIVYNEMKDSLPYFTDICALISDEVKHAKALHTIFLYAVYLKDKKKNQELFKDSSGLYAKKVKAFFNDKRNEDDNIYYQDIAEHVEKYKECGSRSDSSSRQKRLNALKKAINL